MHVYGGVSAATLGRAAGDVRALSRACITGCSDCCSRSSPRGATASACARWCSRRSCGSRLSWRAPTSPDFPGTCWARAQIDNIPLSRIATVTGVYGISFEIVLVNTALAAAFLVPRSRRNVLLAASLLAALALHAGKLVHPPPLPTTHGATLVQANVPILDSGEWTLDYLTQTLDSLAALSVRPGERASRDRPGSSCGRNRRRRFSPPTCMFGTRWRTLRAVQIPTSSPGRWASNMPAIPRVRLISTTPPPWSRPTARGRGAMTRSIWCRSASLCRSEACSVLPADWCNRSATFARGRSREPLRRWRDEGRSVYLLRGDLPGRGPAVR